MTRSPASTIFLTALFPLARLASLATGIDARIIMAQAILESGWGQHAPGNNYFGIKAPQGGGAPQETWEFAGGKWIRISQPFGIYSSLAQCVFAYADLLLTDARYRPLLDARGFDAQVAALGHSGYATDPDYAAKIRMIASGLPT